MIPVIVLKKIPFSENAAGLTIGPVIFVEETHNTKSYVEHEKLHVRLFWAFVGPTVLIAAALWWFGILGLWTALPLAFAGAAIRAGLYNFSEKYRLWEEIKGYAIQAVIENFSKKKMETTAGLIFRNYNVKKATEAKIYGALVNERESYSGRFGA